VTRQDFEARLRDEEEAKPLTDAPVDFWGLIADVLPLPAAPRRQLTTEERLAIFERDGYVCHYCGEKFEVNRLHVDHKRPVIRGGSNHDTNLVTACGPCNGRKHDATYLDYKELGQW
jgi:hypothetical protein